MSEHIDELVNRFLEWKLPQTEQHFNAAIDAAMQTGSGGEGEQS